MRPVHDVDAIRKAEAALMAQLPDGALMQRAATALARRAADILERTYGARVVLLVGKGNNGGDAMYAGARLAARGARVDAMLLGAAEPPAALTSLLRAGGHVRDAGTDDDRALVDAADLVVDGMLGIGGTGALRPPAARLAQLAADSAAVVLAVDVPSGVDAGSGQVDGAVVRADVTVTFGALKPGLVVSPGAEQAGAVDCVDIGLDPHLPRSQLTMADADDVADLLPRLAADTDKYRRGVVGVAAGSDTYTGAAVLATGGAIVAGAGMVRFVSVTHPAELVRQRWPEAVVTVVPSGDGDAVVRAGRVQAWVVGPGLGTGAESAAVVRAVLGTDVPVIVDADGLTVVAEHRDWLSSRTAPTVLTPHAGEFARLVDAERSDVEAHRLTWVRRAAADLGVTVLLKGSTSLVADPDGATRVNPTGTPLLGTAGSGDVLSGAIGALLAAGLGSLDAATVGAYLHGMSARLAGASGATISAADVLAHWHEAVATVLLPG
ncbi:MAG: NAD(P)H-hydrate dehydratase [Actinomycetes bacterium]